MRSTNGGVGGISVQWQEKIEHRDDFLQRVPCYRLGSLSPASAVSYPEQDFDYPAERTISSSPEWPKTPDARGIVTAFARILVSEPCRPLDAIAMPALAADNPSPDLPAVHPILTCRFRGKGPLFKAATRCSPSE